MEEHVAKALATLEEAESALEDSLHEQVMEGKPNVELYETMDRVIQDLQQHRRQISDAASEE